MVRVAISLSLVRFLSIGSTSTVATHWNADPFPVWLFAVAVNEMFELVDSTDKYVEMLKTLSLMIGSPFPLVQVIKGGMGVASAKQVNVTTSSTMAIVFSGFLTNEGTPVGANGNLYK